MSARRAMIESDHQDLSVSRQCEPVELSRASYYRTPSLESEENLMLMRLIDELYTRRPSLGSRSMRDRLRLKGHQVNRKRVKRLMDLMGIASLAPQKKKTTVPAPGHKIYPYLLRNLDINRPDQVWCSDLTYIRLRRGFFFLTAVMDWHSRYVLSWEISVTMDEGFCVSALERATRRHGAPEISNTDQGSQYTGAAYTGVLKDHGVKISMDGRGRATDNIMIERLWRTVKYDDIYLRDYETVEQLTAGLREFFDDYNNERPHSSLGGKTPAQIYFDSSSLRQAA
ncbi:integrase core domain protein [bacterium BMS3Abin01]|nr:integrase core domain protein [bacterium BMS3Abin01]